MTSSLILDHDGGVDDYLSLLLALTFEEHRLEGVVVTPADCYIEPAVGASRKIIDLAGRSEIPVAESTVRGLNPFPRENRRDSFSVDIFPILNESGVVRAPFVEEPGQTWLARTIAAAPEPVTLLVTGPLTTVAAALELEPSMERNIRELAWMGGALRVPGNVSPWLEGGQDGSSEWNVYWDPPAAARVFESSIPIVMCPLDITNRVEMTREFLLTLARNRRHPFSDLAGQCYSLVAHQTYYFWDVLTTAYVERPDLYRIEHEGVRVEPTGFSQGRTVPDPTDREVGVFADVDLEGFYSYVLSSWER
ncbi:MAG TPA: nucleoside hydrolase [Candidatus Limnocylindrales bacterium]